MSSHSKVYAFCESKCKVETNTKVEFDEVESRVETLEEDVSVLKESEGLVWQGYTTITFSKDDDGDWSIDRYFTGEWMRDIDFSVKVDNTKEECPIVFTPIFHRGGGDAALHYDNNYDWIVVGPWKKIERGYFTGDWNKDTGVPSNGASIISVKPVAEGTYVVRLWARKTGYNY